MAFTSPAFSSVPSFISIVPEKFSGTGKPNLLVRGCLSANYEKQSVSLDNDTDFRSNLLKHLKYPIGQPGFAEDIHVEHARKLKAFKHILSRVRKDSFEGLAIIDAVQRLGIDYHFQEEIQQIIRRQYVISATYPFQHHYLQEIPLRFRLLRQEGYNVPTDIFNKFMNKDGKFKQIVREDINSLMGLYEASQLCIGGEDVLDEARQFSSKLLNQSMSYLDPYQAKIVRNTLLYPYHRSSARFMAKKFFLSNFQGENEWIHVFQELAKMDFNLVQSLHRREIVQISNLCNAFLVEAKWFASENVPKAEEYLKNGIISSGVHVVLVHIFFLLGQNVTKETVELIDNNPGIISSTATILRLWDDLGSAKDENQEGKDGSYVHYYMKEHQGSSVQAAEEHAMSKISDAWKCLNKECLSPNPFPASFTRASLNLARMVPLMYSYDDKQRLPSLEEYIKSLLFENEEPTRGVY
ncbi:hypothetical protein Patl1_10961 [Pistacia atlantica]|uniref:Uncharacterized protein n=1 Tax=Pistacia atlantica TaxID=434234 RepID=A0ACC1A531_9ROSI|nr:hypothetical protein Patl1_10961 [Pistacia atlantica]